MDTPLAGLHLTQDTAPHGLENVCISPPTHLPLDEQIAIRQASRFSPAVDFIFFRRFTDGRSSQVAAYIVDNSNNRYNIENLRQLHHKIWLSGATPLLYIGWQDRVDILTCAAGKTVSQDKEWKYSPIETIRNISDITDALARQYSSYRLADGTFWEDQRNAKVFDKNKAAHKVLIDKVKKADKDLDGANNPLARRLLLLTLLIKYLEDRKVFPSNWFSLFCSGADSFYKVLTSASTENIRKMFSALENKFDGDIFVLPECEPRAFKAILTKLANVVDSRSDIYGQLYFWEIYSFEYIPVEVLSHIYQHFAEDGKGAVFTPPLLVNLILDQVMPLGDLRGDETVFDPACGSGIFLVAAFRRLIYIWLSNNNWKKPTPQELKRIFSRSIFGVELQEESVHVASFSLALSICDALLPEIIWNDLRFDKFIGHNLFVGDFGVIGGKAKELATENCGFDIIVGNPPFKSELTGAMKLQLVNDHETIPDKQLAYFFLKYCTKIFLKPHGKICMIQPFGFLYNTNTFEFRKRLFSNIQVATILDFISVRHLFSGADTKIVVLLASNTEPLPDHVINHWTFRRTFAAESQIVFELDHYDHHQVAQSDANSIPWIWRANLLGGGRLYHFAKRVEKMPTLKSFIASMDWAFGEGTNRGKRTNQAEWLIKGMNCLSTQRFTGDVIGQYEIEPLLDDRFEATRKEELFTPPLVLIKENDSLPCAFWNRGPLAYNHSVVGISAPLQDEACLKIFREKFLAVRELLRAILLLFGTRGLTSKSTSILKHEIDRLPWPENDNWEMTQWENELAEDIVQYMAQFIRVGQNSDLLQKNPQDVDIKAYCATFLRLLVSSFPDIVPCGAGCSDGLRFQAFCFGGKSFSSWMDNQNWVSYLRETIFHQHGQAMRTVRVVRLYEGKTLVLIKPNLLRYWIRSSAIRDVDNTIFDILSNE